MKKGKTIFITEDKINMLKDKYRLPKFIINQMKTNCLLGDNKALPIEDDSPYIYKVLKDRYKSVYDAMNNYNEIDKEDISFIKKILNDTLKQCIEIEKPIRNFLEKICFNTVVDTLGVPSDILNIECKLVDKVQINQKIQVKPSLIKDIKYEYEDDEEIGYLQNEILKRRFINSLIQGASTFFSEKYDSFLGKIHSLDKRLIPLYDKINTLNNFLLFKCNDKIDDKNFCQGSFVETLISTQGNISNIKSQGIIFPLLLKETFKGVFEMVASNGLPKDNNKAKFIIKQSDFLKAEPWDLRTGISIWDNLGLNDIDSVLIPYIFSELCEQDYESFNLIMRNILSHTKKGERLKKSLIASSEKKIKYNDFIKDIEKKNDELAMINDSYFTDDELSSMIDDDSYEGTLNEEDVDEDTAYHGSRAEFEGFDLAYLSTGSGNQDYGYGVYLSKEPDVANSYGNILYTVEIPEFNNKKYIIGDKSPSIMTINKIKKALYNILIQEEYKGCEKELSDEFRSSFSNIYDGNCLYGTVSSYLGSDKDTSSLFYELGYYGLAYNTNSDKECYVMFNANDIKIIKKEKI